NSKERSGDGAVAVGKKPSMPYPVYVAQTFRFDGWCAWYGCRHFVCGFRREVLCRSPSGLKP
ncbi:MAG: hypothetical protein AAB331_05130, partial [Planctomycetota bacterium]